MRRSRSPASSCCTAFGRDSSDCHLSAFKVELHLQSGTRCFRPELCAAKQECLLVMAICTRAMSTTAHSSGTEGSNPSPSSGESGANPDFRLPDMQATSRSNSSRRRCASGVVMTSTAVWPRPMPDGMLQAVRCRSHLSSDERTCAIRHLFLFIGADPNTDWLAGSGITLDDRGFIRTGANFQGPLETNLRGVFAIGDVRCGSVKRVAAAVGEGAQVVAALHAFLAKTDGRATPPRIGGPDDRRMLS
jgi:hypothetical protein